MPSHGSLGNCAMNIALPNGAGTIGRQTDAASAVLRLLTLNVGLQSVALPGGMRMAVSPHLERRLAAAPALLRICSADVIALQEVFLARDRAFLRDAMRGTHPYSYCSRRSRSLVGNGLFVLSRLPIEQGAHGGFVRKPFLSRAIWERGFASIDFQIPKLGAVRLINTHLSPDTPYTRPDGAASRTYRTNEIDDLVSETRTSDCTTILAGDFNASPEICPQDYARILHAGFVDAFAAVHGEIHAPTYDRENPLVATGPYKHWPSQRSDHVFLKAGSRLVPLAAEIVLREHAIDTEHGTRCPLSDHYGVLVTLGFQARPAIHSS